MIDDIHRLVGFASAARAEATYNSPDLGANGKRGIVVTVDITAETGTATLDVKVQRKDRLSGKYTDIPGAAIAQMSAVGVAELVIYPGIAEAANLAVSSVISEDFRLVATVGGTTVTLTFTVGIALIP
jgi:hypothetical protein